ncbi:MAG: rhamnogalacturonan acetylesterase, partial [Paludibacteraceae bacterium]|nr:rhamnogalacturonan acetylesterase [Paludibacteraceae bacterium]
MKKFLSLLSAFLLMVVPLFGQQLRVFTIGDSTVQDYNDGYAPRKGWGQMLPFFFDKSKAVVYNKAIGGTSSKSFYEKHWAAVRGQLQKGDYVFIQFGINDRNSSDANRYAPKGVFEGYIKKFVADVRAKGAIPVLVSTVRRCAWTNGKPYDSYHEHPQLMRDVAKEVSAPLVDLDKFCYDLFVAQGELYAQRYLTMHLQAGEYGNYKNGASDQVHYQEIGATENARFVVESIEKSNDADLKKLAACTLPRYKVTFKINDPSKAKTVSRSAEFPAGINVTLKTIPQNGAKFIRWEDGSGKSVATKSLHVLKMGSADVTYKAVYESNIKEKIEPTLSINNQNKSLVASEAKSYKWYFNNKVISGETKSSLAISQNGTYSVEMVLNDGTTAKLHICVTIGKDGVIRKIYL